MNMHFRGEEKEVCVKGKSRTTPNGKRRKQLPTSMSKVKKR